MTKLTDAEDFAMCSPEQIAADIKASERDAFPYIEDELRAKVATHEGKVQSIVQDANHIPGYYYLSLRTWLSRNPERRAWVKAANDAVKRKLVKRGLNGRFYPIYHVYPTPLEYLRDRAPLIKAVALLLLFMTITCALVTYGNYVIAQVGWFGYAIVGAGLSLALLVSFLLWDTLNR